MTIDSLAEDWAILRAWLPADLEERAWRHGLWQRARKVKQAERWLRLLLMHVAGGLSLQQTVLRAAELGWARLSAPALTKRLQKAQPWLADLTAYLLAEQQRRLTRTRWPQRWIVRLLDATDIQEPGSTGTAWRLHYSFQLPHMVCDEFVLTDGSAAEQFSRFTFHPGELALADRGYSHRAGLAHVLHAGAEVLVRWNPGGLPLETLAGEPFAALNWLRSLPPRAAREEQVCFTWQGQRYALRLCARRKSQQAAERAQAKIKRKAQRNGRQYRPETLEYAQYILVLCSPPAQALSTHAALDFYRGRWQVELAFKRFKSLLEAGHVPKRNDATARAWMQAKMLTALLLERILWEAGCLSPQELGFECRELAQSLDSLLGSTRRPARRAGPRFVFNSSAQTRSTPSQTSPAQRSQTSAANPPNHRDYLQVLKLTLMGRCPWLGLHRPVGAKNPDFRNTL